MKLTHNLLTFERSIFTNMNTKKNIWILSFTIALFCLFTLNIKGTKAHAATTKPTYQVTPTTKPINKSYLKYSTYNDQTKNYYMLRSYLEKLESTKGGKLILKKGTYLVSNALYVPSNVTIELSDGAKIIKGKSTGSKIVPSKSIFQFIRPSKAY